MNVSTRSAVCTELLESRTRGPIGFHAFLPVDKLKNLSTLVTVCDIVSSLLAIDIVVFHQDVAVRGKLHHRAMIKRTKPPVHDFTSELVFTVSSDQ